MASKLGTQLVREGVISAQQLEEALRVQVLYGGRLGTNLVELGFVPLEVMADWLGRTTGFPVATLDLLASATDEAIALIPADMAERFEVFPLRKDGRRLHLAMSNPSDLAATDALSFKTGLRIVPYVAPEVRLYHFLELRYGIVRKLRYARLADVAAGRTAGQAPAPPAAPNAWSAPESVAPPPSTQPVSTTPHSVAPPPPTPRLYTPGSTPPPIQPPRPLVPGSLPPPIAPRATTPPSLRPSVPPVMAPPTVPPVMPGSVASGASRPPPTPVPPSGWGAPPPVVPPAVSPGVRPTMPPAVSPPTAGVGVPTLPPTPPDAPAAFVAAVPSNLPPVPPAQPAYSLGDAQVALQIATTREEIAEAVLRYGRDKLDNMLLVLVRDGMALGWRGGGVALDGAMIELLMLPLNVPSMFQEAHDTKQPYVGPVPDAALHKHFYKALRRDPPPHIVVVPVLMRERCVNVIYGDRSQPLAPELADELTELATHVSAAYERLVREHKRRLEGR